MNTTRLSHTYIPKNFICITNALHNHVKKMFVIVEFLKGNCNPSKLLKW
jgi:hypothetical protein